MKWNIVVSKRPDGLDVRQPPNLRSIDLRGDHHGDSKDTSPWIRCIIIPVLTMAWSLSLKPLTYASHQGLETHAQEMAEATGPGHPIAGAPFQVYLAQGTGGGEASKLSRTEVNPAVQTVVDAFTHMMEHRNEYHRFNEALTRAMLDKVIIEPKVVNREGKEFSFLVARTKQKGRVNLLISAVALVKNGYLHHPESLATLLAREFQWVVSKADTAPKPKAILIERDLENAPIQTNNKAVLEMSADERDAILQQLFEMYLTTVDDFKSLENQPFYDGGTTTLIQPTHPDSTIKLYDIRVHEALQKIVRDPYFNQHTPRAVRSLLNGTIWNMSFVNIVERD